MTRLLLCGVVVVGTVIRPATAQQAGPRGTAVPLPVLFYQPETGTGYGAAIGYFFRFASSQQTSKVGLLGVRTSKKQTIVRLESELYPMAGRYRLYVRAGYSRFPTKYWGVGNDAPAKAEEDYTPETLELNLEAQRRFGANWFVGPLLTIRRRALADVAAGGLLQTGSTVGIGTARVVGVGARVTRDTRDNTVFPRAGWLAQLSLMGFDGAWGSEFDYATIGIDVRRYVSFASAHVVALRALVSGTTANPPFDLLPMVGGNLLLRGYYDGRFRNRQLIAMQSEYRSPVVWRFGLVGFLAVGQVQPRFNDFRLGAFKTTVGTGLRIQLSKREGLNIRADYGWGIDVKKGGFYLAIGEAF